MINNVLKSQRIAWGVSLLLATSAATVAAAANTNSPGVSAHIIAPNHPNLHYAGPPAK